MANLERMLDEAMAKCGAKSCSLATTSTPVYEVKRDSEFALKDFVKHACRPVDHAKSCTLVLDAHYNIPELGIISALCERLQDQDYSVLPPHLQPAEAMPSGTTVSYIINNSEDGVLDILRVMSFTGKVPTKQARACCTGSAVVPAFRQGPWTWVKAVHYLMDMLPGHHVVWWRLSQAQGGQGIQRSSSSQQQWCPEDEELLAGVEYINKKAPDQDDENQQYVWILRQIRPDSGTPIAGWPKSEVKLMAQNKSRAAGGASSSRFFPFTTMSLKPFMHAFLLPMVFPLMLSYGIITVGWPGVGKTPFLIVLSLALGRYHINKNGHAHIRPGWRRAKAMDNFRHKCGQSHEGIILDDPTIEKIEASDLKSWLTSEEDQNCTGRYNDVKLARNGLRALASNDLEESDEPPPDRLSTSITAAEFMKLTRKLFQAYKEADVLAILKRSIVFVFGKHAVYLRLPDQDLGAPVHRILVSQLHADLFCERDKEFYAKYKIGVEELPPTFEEDVKCEQALILHGLADLAHAGRPSTYIKSINTKIADKLQDISRETNTTWLPSSQSSDEDAAPKHTGPVVPHAAPPPGTPRRRLGDFVYPTPTRRVRMKSCNAAAQSSVPQPEEEAAQSSVPQPDKATDSFSGEEDAAHTLHS